jgi:serine/threonine protein phosphatase PrpC
MALSRSAPHSIPRSLSARPSALERPPDAAVAPSALVSRRTSLAPLHRLRVNTHFAVNTDKGRGRADNQDSFIIDRELELAVVCDGMGGHLAGARASKLAARVFKQAIIAGKPLLRSYLDHESAARVTKRDISDLLREAANAASRAVHEDGKRRAQCAGMGTTLVAMLVLANHAFIVNVGDSRAYLLRGGALEQLTHDHSVYDELLRSGHLPPGALPRSGFRHILTRAVGTRESCEADTFVVDIGKGDRILLCSDGVHQYFDTPEGSPDDLLHQLLETDGASVADTLIEIANERGGCDDMTAVVLTIGRVGDHDADELDARRARHDALARSPLFRTLDERERSTILALADVQCFQPGETIIGQGAPGGNLYVLLRGAVTVDGPAMGTFALHHGQPVTEMPWLEAERLSTRAVATEPSELLVLPRQGLLALFRSDSELADKVLRRTGSLTASQSP